MTDGALTVWTTSSDLNRTVCRAVAGGFERLGVAHTVRNANGYAYANDDGPPPPSLSYGFLRGTAEIYRACAASGVDWYNIDKPFFGFKHTSGYYRVGRRHLQPRFSSRLVGQLDQGRIRSCRISLRPWTMRRVLTAGSVLLCPPTDALSAFYRIDVGAWIQQKLAALPEPVRSRVVIRRKHDPSPLHEALEAASLVITHSSNVAIEAIAAGIPAIADEGFVRSWNGLAIDDPESLAFDQRELDRMELLTQAVWNQYTLAEFGEGFAWRSLSEIWRAQAVEVEAVENGVEHG